MLNLAKIDLVIIHFDQLLRPTGDLDFRGIFFLTGLGQAHMKCLTIKFTTKKSFILKNFLKNFLAKLKKKSTKKMLVIIRFDQLV